MTLVLSCQIFPLIFSLTTANHFLGGSFTYRHVDRFEKDNLTYKSIQIEIRFHLSNHFFICSPEQINQRIIAYLVGESVPNDNVTNTYRWHDTITIKKDKHAYEIQCLSDGNSACDNFKEEMWAHCESVNQISGYSILRREFPLRVEPFKTLNLFFLSCCWANSVLKTFAFHLFIDTIQQRINSSPYPHIPASYYVAVNKSTPIKIYSFDADGDRIICEPQSNNLGGFLTVHVDIECNLKYNPTQIGKQFGQFWLMDQNEKNVMLSRSLISVQVLVLDNISCDNQPELIVESKTNQSNRIIIKRKESIDINVRLNPRCLLIQPQDQTITELTTLCSNNQPTILATGGIEVRFRCTPELCDKYQVCFVGEIGLKQPATNVECLLIEVTGTKAECGDASKHGSRTSHNRHFHVMNATNQTEIMIGVSNTQSRQWFWIPIVCLALLVGSIGYFGIKHILLASYYRSFFDKNSHSLSSRSSAGATTERSVLTSLSDTKHLPSTDLENQKITSPSLDASHKHDISATLPNQRKAKAQHVRLGPFEDDD